MPELPEVETVRRTLTPLLTGRRIVSVEAVRPEVLAHPLAEEFCALAADRNILELGRRGKYLLIKLEGGASVIVHLRMTGRLLCTPAIHERKPHTHVVFRLDNGQELRYSDVRRFGRLWLQQSGENDDFSGIHKLGLEPFDAAFNADYLRDKLSARRINIKQALLDQSVIAGLGNIYVDEVLYQVKLHPCRPVADLKKKDWQALAAAVPEVLLQAIANNGTTFRDYLDGEGKEGSHMPYLEAYGRRGEPCRRCGEQIERMKVAGRSSYFCPICQKEK